MCFFMLTDRMINGMVEAVLKTRLPIKMIARVSGITYQTLRNWLKNGEKYKQRIENGEIKKGDLNTAQKREIKLYEKLSVERTYKVQGYLDKIHAFAEKHEDIKAYQWLLKIEDPIFRDVVDAAEESDTGMDSTDVFVVTIAACGKQSVRLLSEYIIDESVKDGEEKEGHSEGTEGIGK